MHVTFTAQKLDIGIERAICSIVFLDDGYASDNKGTLIEQSSVPIANSSTNTFNISYGIYELFLLASLLCL